MCVLMMNEWWYCLVMLWIARRGITMSLFQVREWWSTTVGVAEEFDMGNMVVGNLDNEASGAGEWCLGEGAQCALRDS